MPVSANDPAVTEGRQSDDQVSGILKERARLLARRLDSPLSGEQEQEPYLCFRLGLAGLYGIPFTEIEEIISLPEITRVPCTPDIYAGVANYRGELLSVLDIKTFFQAVEHDSEAEARVVVIRAGRVMAGLLVDEVVSTAAYANQSLTPFIATAAGSVHACVVGIHEGNVMILSASALLNDKALTVNEPPGR